MELFALMNGKKMTKIKTIKSFPRSQKKTQNMIKESLYAEISFYICKSEVYVCSVVKWMCQEK